MFVAATMATRESRRGSASLQSSCRSMDWLARDGLRADQHERYVQPLYEPWAICSLESRSTYRARLGCDDLPSSRVSVTSVRLSFEWSQSNLSRLFPPAGVEIALGGAIVERERCGVSGPRREGVAHDRDDAGLGQAGKALIGSCRKRGEKEGRHQGGGEKRARHRQLWETERWSGPVGQI